MKLVQSLEYITFQLTLRWAMLHYDEELASRSLNMNEM